MSQRGREHQGHIGSMARLSQCNPLVQQCQEVPLRLNPNWGWDSSSGGYSHAGQVGISPVPMPE